MQKFIMIFLKPENFSDFFWSYVNHKPIVNSRKLSDIPKDTNLSKISKNERIGIYILWAL